MYGPILLGLALWALGHLKEEKTKHDNDTSELRAGGHDRADLGGADPGGDLRGGHLDVGLDPDALGDGGSDGGSGDRSHEPSADAGNVRAGVENEPPANP